MRETASSFTAEHWHNRAEEARAVAESMVSPSGRLEMLKISAAYEHMAERLEAMTSLPKKPAAA